MAEDEQRDEGEGRSDRLVDLGVRVLVALCAVAGNAFGAATVFALTVWVLPTDEVAGETSPILLNLIFAAGFVAISVPLASWWVLRRQSRGRAWVREERQPNAEELRVFLRAPIHVAVATGFAWLVAAMGFAAYNATFSLELGARVGLTVALSGLTTAAVSYLLSERLLRPAAARALDRTVLEEPALPGVTARISIGWLLASGVPLLGLLMVGLSTLIERDFGRDQLALTAVVLSGLGLLVGLATILLAARATAAPVVAVREAMREVEQGDLDVDVEVYDGSELGLLQSGFNEMAEGLRERERMRRLFGQHVGEEVAREAIEAGAELGGEVREVGVLFCDIVGSTRLASEREPQEVVDLLNRFFGVVVEVVAEHGGVINKFEGDAALAIFGAPRPIADPAGCALAAARTLSERLRHELEQLEAGVGVSYGRVVAGNIGSEERLEYTVIGDAVNVAARLTELAKERSPMLLATADALQAAGDEASNWRAAESAELRGKQEPIELAVPG